jgi:hypothetical protein
LAFHSGREVGHSPPSSAEIKKWVELYLHSPNTPSWCGAQLGEHRGTWAGGLDDQNSIPGRAGYFSLWHHVQTGSGAHTASYPMGTGGSLHGVKQPGCETDHSPPSSAKVKACVELYFHSPNTFSWGGA